MSLAIAVGIGVFAGISSGLFGIGGGIIIVPLVLYVYKFSQQGATATSLIALLLPVGSLGLWQYYKAGFIDGTNVKVGLAIAAGMLVGAFFGAKIAAQLQGETLTKIFAAFLVLVAVRLWFSA